MRYMNWFFAVGLPKKWPPPSVQFLAELSDSGFILGSSPFGHLLIFQQQLGSAQVHSRFQPIIAQGGEKVVITVTHDREENIFQILINEIQLQLNNEAPIVLKSLADAETGFYALPALDLRVSERQNYLTRLFLETVQDLMIKLEDRSEYSLIRCSALLRQLLLEDMISVANKYRAKVYFNVCRDIPHPTELSPSLVYSGVLPLVGNHEVLDMARFLAKRIALIADSEITVRDIIDAVANNRGGIHFRNSARAKQVPVLEMDDSGSNMKKLSLSFIREIGITTVRAVAPLVQQLQKENGDLYAPNWSHYLLTKTSPRS